MGCFATAPYFTDFQLAKQQLGSVELGLGETILEIDETTTASVASALMSDGSTADLTDATVSYESSAPEVATVDTETGVVTGVASGKTMITISVTLDGVTKTQSKWLTVWDNITMTYLLGKTTEPYGEAVDIRGITYANTDGSWEYYGIDPDWTTAATTLTTNKYTVYDNIRLVASPAYPRWVALKIQVPEAGTYLTSMGYKTANNGDTFSVDVIPITPVADITALLDSKTPLGSFSTYNASGTANASTKRYETGVDSPALSTIEIPEAGEYLLIIRHVVPDPVRDNARGYFVDFNLTKNTLSSVELGIGKSVLEVNEATTASVTSALMADGTAVNLNDTVISYESSAPDVATVNSETGVVTAVSSGTAVITASVTLGGITKTANLEVTVGLETETLVDDGQIIVTATDATSDTGIDGAVTGNAPGFVQNDTNFYQLGTSVTVSAADIAGKEFKYWKHVPSERVVCTSKNFSFKVGSDTYITAVYSEPATGQYLVEFLDKNGKVLQSDYLDENAAITEPDEPFAVGYEFDDWSPEVPATATKNETFIAQYSVLAPTFELTVTGPATVTGGISNPYAYNSKIELTVDSGSIPDGEKFAYWQRDGKVISYATSYSFYMWDTTSVTAVCVPEGSTVTQTPQIMMDSVKTATGRIIFCSERVIPEGFELIESGILIKQGSGTASSLKLTGGTYDYKAVSQSTEPAGQFTVRRDGVSGNWYARAYVIYKSGTDIKVVYSNIVNGTV